jgi:tetratricopeptide (TPR) repeat protein
MGRPVEARALIDELKRADSGEPMAFEAEGLLLHSERKSEEAIAAYARAIELGSASFYVHYRWASLLWKGNVDRETLTRVRDAAARSVELNADFAWGQALLAEAQAALGEVTLALASARHAVELGPGVAEHRLSLARALWKAGQTDAARQEAGAALALAESGPEHQRVQEFMEFLKQNPRP